MLRKPRFWREYTANFVATSLGLESFVDMIISVTAIKISYAKKFGLM